MRLAAAGQKTGIGLAAGSSRHFTIANPMINGQSVGSQGAIALPIPGVSPPSGTITIIKQTNPAVATGTTFAFSGDLGAFNSSRDSGTFTPGSSATAQLSKTQANIDALDIPQFPGPSDEDPGTAPVLGLAKTVTGSRSASATDFTLTATCSSGACTGSTVVRRRVFEHQRAPRCLYAD